jgi:hypothetical protein
MTLVPDNNRIYRTKITKLKKPNTIPVYIQRGMWMREIQGVGKEKGEYCVSERFKCENRFDANVRALHVDKAGHIR